MTRAPYPDAGAIAREGEPYVRAPRPIHRRITGITVVWRPGHVKVAFTRGWVR